MKKTIFKRVALCLAMVIVLAFTAAVFVACSAFKQSVSSVDDLYAMQSNKSYKLTCDLNLQGRDWTPLSVKNFDGNGHTISNCVINSSSQDYCGFFNRALRLTNVVFDNISGMATLSYETPCAGIAAGEVGMEINNVTVRNSQFTIIQSKSVSYGNFGIAVGLYGNGAASMTDSMGSKAVDNISVENCILDVTLSTSSSCYVGAVGSIELSGNAPVASNISVKNSEIVCNDKGKGAISVGCVCGSANYVTLKGCSVNECSLEVKTSDSSPLVGGIAGVLGEKGAVERCAVLNCDFNASSEDNCYVGGLVGRSLGKITESLSDENSLYGATSSSAKDDVCNVGGVVGYSGSTLSKCVSQSNGISNGSSSSQANKKVACGMVGVVKGSVANCAVYGNTVSGGSSDVFASKCDTVFNCAVYVSGSQSFANVNEVEVLDASEWQNVITALSLDNALWKMADGKLSLNIIK